MPPKLVFSLPALSQALKAIAQRSSATAGSGSNDSSSGSDSSSPEDLAQLRQQLLLLGRAGSRLKGLELPSAGPVTMAPAGTTTAAAPGAKKKTEEMAPALSPSGPDRLVNDEQGADIVNLLQVRRVLPVPNLVFIHATLCTSGFALYFFL